MRANRHSGFTLIELMIALAILGIAATVAVPQMSAMIANRRVATAADDLYASLILTRGEAISENLTVELNPYDDGTWSEGWQVEDPVNAGSFFVQHAFTNLTVVSTVNKVSYLPSGRLPSGVVPTFTLCDTRKLALRRIVSVGLDGMPTLTVGAKCS